MEDQRRIYPRISAFEELLRQVYLDIWELQDEPALFAKRVRFFSDVVLPDMFYRKVREHYPEMGHDYKIMKEEEEKWKEKKREMNPMERERVDNDILPQLHAEFAEKVWKAIMNALTDLGFNFPIVQPALGFPISKMKRREDVGVENDARRDGGIPV